ncbi:MAG: hypothetical protein RL732_115 [Bacteroidota bacterium]
MSEWNGDLFRTNDFLFYRAIKKPEWPNGALRFFFGLVLII